LPIKIALCQKFYAKRIRNRAKSEFQISHLIGIKFCAGQLILSASEIRHYKSRGIFAKENIIYAKQQGKRGIQSKRRGAAFIYGGRGLALGIFQMNESGLYSSIKPFLCASLK
jgi:hypothetical protein